MRGITVSQYIVFIPLFLPKAASKSRRKLVSSFSGGRVLRKERNKARDCSLCVLLPSSDGALGSELMDFLQHHQCLLGFPTSAPATIVSDAVSLCLSHVHHVTPAQPPHPGLSSGVTLTLTMETLWLPPTPSLPHLPVGAREQL